MNHGFLRVGVANPEIRVAEPEYNANAVVAAALEAEKEGVEVLAFPELCLTGYTCGDLFFQKTLIKAAERALAKVAESTKNADMLICVGLPVSHENKLYNVCAVLNKGNILGLVPKTHYPEYGEFNELRYFTRAEKMHVVPLCGQVCTMAQAVFAANDEIPVGVEICEDLWASCPPSSDCAALVTVNISASSETVGKAEKRRALVLSQSLRTCSAYVYADAGRGESTTDLVFSGHGIITEKGKILAENKPFENKLLTFADIDTDFLAHEREKNNTVVPHDANRFSASFTLCERSGKIAREVSRLPFVPQENGNERAELILTMQAEGLRKRMEASGAKKLVLGVSGGLDSALALLVCLRALKIAKMPAKNVLAISMPGFGTTDETAQNALALAKESKTEHRCINICESVKLHLSDIGHDLSARDVAYENAQARMRTMILMDIANAENGLAIGTGDLSEAALGWCTYNGDHMSMYGVNASVPKTLVKYLVRHEAERIGGGTKKALIGILNTEISPELLPAENGKISQKTEDIIGSFELNDFFLFYSVRCGCAPKKTLLYASAAFGGEPKEYAEPLARFYKRFFGSQFKRSCSPDGAKIGFSLSPRGDWRMPSDASVKLWLSECDAEK